MKSKYLKTIFSILILFISCSALSQDSRLFDKDWNLVNLIIDGTSYPNPMDDSNNPVNLNFNQSPSNLTTSVCDSHQADLSFGSDDVSFETLHTGTTLGGCSLYGDQSGIEFLYFNFFSAFSAFNYEIFDENLNIPRMLIITAENGDTAEYITVSLSVNAFSRVTFSIVPNPVINDLIISSKSDLTKSNLKIFDLNGQLVVYQRKFSKIVNVEKLSKGLYFLEIEDGFGRKVIKKFIK